MIKILGWSLGEDGTDKLKRSDYAVCFRLNIGIVNYKSITNFFFNFSYSTKQRKYFLYFFNQIVSCNQPRKGIC